MPRVNRVEHCRKSPGACGKCGEEIKIKDAYVWWKFRYGGKCIRCAKPGCVPKPSDLTQSEFYGTLYSIQEAGFTADTLEDLESERDDIKGQLEELRDEQEEKRSNMPESLQESDTGNTLQERYDALEEAVNNLDSVNFNKEDDETLDEAIERTRQELSDILDSSSV